MTPTELVIFLAKEAEDESRKGMKVHAMVQGKSKQFCLAEIQDDGIKLVQIVWVYVNPLGSGAPSKIFLAEHFYLVSLRNKIKKRALKEGGLVFKNSLRYTRQDRTEGTCKGGV